MAIIKDFIKPFRSGERNPKLFFVSSTTTTISTTTYCFSTSSTAAAACGKRKKRTVFKDHNGDRVNLDNNGVSRVEVAR